MKRLTRGWLVLAAACAACSGTGVEPRLTRLPRELSTGETQLVAAGNSFAFGLLRAVVAADTSPGDNIFISPLSVSVALGMTLNGAAGTTADQMRATLGFGGLAQGDVNAGYRGLIDLLGGLDSHVAWRLANSVWYRQDYTFNPAFFDSTSRYFDALVSPLDFSSANAGPTINQWVSDRTAGRIPTIVPDRLPSDGIMYLINAIYFKGAWTTQFDPAKTYAQPFHTAAGAVSVPMMHGHEVPLRAGSAAGFTIVELPYARGAFVMTVVVPADTTALDSIARHVTEDDWNGWLARLDSGTSDVVLPKFTTRYAAGLNAVLKSLGMTDAFCTSGAADFTALDPSGRACVDTVVHKTFVQVDEAGTEAAAATSVGIGVTAAPPSLVVDRPFLFAIRERFSGTIIFIGVIRNPALPPD